MIELRDIVKDYPSGDQVVHALSGVSIRFRDSEFVSVLGPSGGGKTTLLNILGGLDHYTSGDLVINGRSTKGYRESDWDTYRNHSVGFVFQSYNLIPHQSVLANVELALTMSGVGRAERHRRAQEALESVGLADQMHKRPAQLSGGQMQRVAIARALVNDPDIVLADEPTGALDSQTSVQVLEILKKVSHDRLVIMVTHNPELAERYSTRVVHLLDGRVTSDSRPFEADEEPAAAATSAAATPGSAAATSVAAGQELQRQAPHTKGRRRMSPATAMGLSMRNLMTKRGRTLLTAFAGSIGIIGISLILSLSNGAQNYITRVEQDTLSSYPIEVKSESVDLSSMMGAMGAMTAGSTPGSSTDNADTTQDAAKDKDATPTDVTVDSVMGGIIGSISGGTAINDLEAFRAWLEDGDGQDIYALANDVSYGYDTQLYVYSADTSDGVLQVNPSTLLSNVGLSNFSSETSTESSAGSLYVSMNSSYSMGNQVDVWKQLMDNDAVLNSQYKVLAGREAKAADEVVLLTDKDGHISDYMLYALGMQDQDEVAQMFDDVISGKQVDAGGSKSLSFDDFLGMRFKLVLPSELYQRGDDGVWHSIRSDQQAMRQVVDNAPDLTIVGVMCPNDDAALGKSYGSIGYTAALTRQVVEQTAASELTQDQLSHPDIDVFTGLPFEDKDSDAQDVQDTQDEKSASAAANKKDAASASTAMDEKDAEGASAAADEKDAPDAGSASADASASAGGAKSALSQKLADKAGALAGASAGADRAAMGSTGLGGMLSAAGTGIPGGMSAGAGMPAGFAGAAGMPTGFAGVTGDADVPEFSSIDDLYAYLDTLPGDEATAMKAQLDQARAMGFPDDLLLSQAQAMMSGDLGAMYGAMGSSSAAGATLEGTHLNDEGELVSTATYEGNLKKIGVAEVGEPSSITIYPRSFEDKEKIVSLIEDYNRQMNDSGQEDKVIQYSDYVGLIMSSVSNVINAISYILIAFVAISLVVSSIMIGIITYISVLERTKEIGVLRSIGASRGDIAMVFNAETFVIGLASGVLGILVTVLLDIPANIVIEAVSGVHNLAQLPPLAALILIGISVVLTVGAGLIPARIASKKDPVVALRTE